jgi:hypothetical protein
MVEEEVFMVLGDARERDPKQLIFDMEPSNHMTGIREVFVDLDTDVVGTVWFGDGSVVWIKGCGTILFACKSGEHLTLANTYYILCLTASIVSCGQLDKDRFQIHIEHGVMRICYKKMWLLAKIGHSVRQLYVLDITITQPVCLAACGGKYA